MYEEPGSTNLKTGECKAGYYHFIVTDVITCTKCLVTQASIEGCHDSILTMYVLFQKLFSIENIAIDDKILYKRAIICK